MQSCERFRWRVYYTAFLCTLVRSSAHAVLIMAAFMFDSTSNHFHYTIFCCRLWCNVLFAESSMRSALLTQTDKGPQHAWLNWVVLKMLNCNLISLVFMCCTPGEWHLTPKILVHRIVINKSSSLKCNNFYFISCLQHYWLVKFFYTHCSCFWYSFATISVWQTLGTRLWLFW